MNIEKIKLVLTDIDGVLTDNKYFFWEGELYRTFNVKDGLAFELLKTGGIETGIITAKISKQAERRFKELGVKFYYEGVQNKLTALEEILGKGYSLEEIGYIGDDLPDIQILKKVGFSACPKDACKEVKEIVNYVSDKNGGEGVFRDVAEYVLKGQKKWEKILKLYGF